jgi:hypothetical protein
MEAIDCKSHTEDAQRKVDPKTGAPVESIDQYTSNDWSSHQADRLKASYNTSPESLLRQGELMTKHLDRTNTQSTRPKTAYRATNDKHLRTGRQRG